MQEATADRVHKVLDPMLRVRNIDESTLTAWRAQLEELLAAGPLTRAEIAARLAGTEFAFDGMTLGLVLMWAELEQVIASGPPRGMTHTYGLVDQPRQRLDQDESIVWLVGQFLASHGPSSVPALCGWSSLTVTSVRRALAELGDRVHSEEILGADRHWIGPLTDGAWPAEPTVALLNGYDEYISGLDSRSKTLLDPDRLYQGRTGTPIGVLMVDGKLAGHWRRIRSAKQVRLEVTPLRSVTPPELTGLQREAEDYAKFAGSAGRPGPASGLVARGVRSSRSSNLHESIMDLPGTLTCGTSAQVPVTATGNEGACAVAPYDAMMMSWISRPTSI